MSKLVPKLRFKEFSGEWEEKTLDNIGNIVTGNTPKTNESDNYGDEKLFVSPADISEGRYIYTTNKKLTAKGFLTTRPVKAESILVVCIGSTIGKVAQSKFECATNQQINSIVPFDKYDNNFIYSTLEKDAKKIKSMAGNHAVPIINKTAFSSIKILVPQSRVEQEKISNILSSLDNLIEAQNKKVEALKEHKKGLMQQLFPQEDAKVPKRRFEGFSGEWEEKVLKNISPAIFDGTHQTPKYTNSGIPFFSVENIISRNKNKFISTKDYIESTKKNKPEKDDILITRIGNIGFSTLITWDYNFAIYVTLAVIKKSEKFYSEYLHYYFQSPKYQSEILSKSLLNAVPCKINIDELRKTKAFLPPDNKQLEQQKIANCLSSLDNLIETKNKKIEALKEHKKGLMQQLFVSEDR